MAAWEGVFKSFYLAPAFSCDPLFRTGRHSWSHRDGGHGFCKYLLYLLPRVQFISRCREIKIEGEHERYGLPTAFDKGINRFTWLMLRFMLVMVPTVFLINGLPKGNWFEAFMFAVAVAVGLTPEMLAIIVTVNLAKGALSMAKKKVIVKRLNAIQNFGAMDILCSELPNLGRKSMSERGFPLSD